MQPTNNEFVNFNPSNSRSTDHQPTNCKCTHRDCAYSECAQCHCSYGLCADAKRAGCTGSRCIGAKCGARTVSHGPLDGSRWDLRGLTIKLSAPGHRPSQEKSRASGSG